MKSDSTSQTERWSCDAPITVALAGPAPDGAQKLLKGAVKTLALHSGLPLRNDTDTRTKDDEPGTITVRYVPHLKDASPTAIDVGSRHFTQGHITRGNVWLLNTTETNTPTHPQARAVLMHEIMHALGAEHAAADAPEIMAPSIAPNTPHGLGPGDRAMLAALGCS